MPWCRLDREELVLDLHVQPGSRTDMVAGIYKDCLKIKIAARAVEDRANQGLVVFLSGQFGVPRSKIRITRGRNSRHKTVVIAGVKVLPEWFRELRTETGT